MKKLSYIDIKPEVKDALNDGRPVVALESAIISHGMPYPDNLAMAKKVEEIVRECGAVPATIAVIDGRLKAGLEDSELEMLALGGNDIIKTGRRNLANIVSQGLSGATTASSTMIIAQMAGIKVFVSGGIGGAHRGAENTFDISADLQELAKTSVAVVCAGAKPILDIGLTLEYLETMGVPVVGYGTDKFPAFYTRDSGYECDFSFDDVHSLACMIKCKWDMGLYGGVLVANPIPQQFAVDEKVVDTAVQTALEECARKGLRGKAATPFLTSRVRQLTGGASLNANRELIYNNAKVGSALATSLAKLYK